MTHSQRDEITRLARVWSVQRVRLFDVMKECTRTKERLPDIRSREFRAWRDFQDYLRTLETET